MRDLKIVKLTDEGGQYLVILKCECGHTRRCYPHTLAALAGGWDANLADVARRMRCSKCNQKKCTAHAMRETAPRGHRSH
jgi:hypothetical protein